MSDSSDFEISDFSDVEEDSDELSDFEPIVSKKRKAVSPTKLPKTKKRAAPKKSTAAASKSKAAAGASSTKPSKSKAESKQSDSGRVPVASKSAPVKKKKAPARATSATSGRANAAPKSKKGSIPEKDAPPIILEYARKQNRPYSVLDIYNNLHGTIKKPSVQRVCDALVSKGDLCIKHNKKQKLYWPDQSSYPDVTAEQLAELATQDTALRKEAQELASTVRTKESKLRELSSSLSDQQLQEEEVKLEQQVRSMEARLSEISAAAAAMGESAVFDASAKAKLVEKGNFYLKVWKQRKRSVMDVLDSMADSMEKKLSEVTELCGLETDEEHEIDLKTFDLLGSVE